MKYKKVTVAGGGVLGSQIAFQSAYCGFDVTIYLSDEKYVMDAKEKIDSVKDKYIKALEEMEKGISFSAGIADSDKKLNKKECLDKINKAYNSIKYETDIKKATLDTDLVIESIPENFEIKRDFYIGLKPYLEDKTVVVTNSSSLLPSSLAKFTGREDKFLALHFANSIWKNNTAEVMGHELTNKEVFNDVVSFANDIRMFVLPIMKEKAGYLLNSLLIPFLLSGLDMYANGIAEPSMIDEAWTRGTGAPKGPFAIIDTVGLSTALNIVEQYQKVPGLLSPLLKKMLLPYNFKGMKKILVEFMNEGKTGKAAGEGFYKYDKDGNRM